MTRPSGNDDNTGSAGPMHPIKHEQLLYTGPMHPIKHEQLLYTGSAGPMHPIKHEQLLYTGSAGTIIGGGSIFVFGGR